MEFSDCSLRACICCRILLLSSSLPIIPVSWWEGLGFVLSVQNVMIVFDMISLVFLLTLHFVSSFGLYRVNEFAFLINDNLHLINSSIVCFLMFGYILCSNGVYEFYSSSLLISVNTHKIVCFALNAFL